jgi:hypothetical protein
MQTLVEVLEALERESRPAVRDQMLKDLDSGSPTLLEEVKRYFSLSLDPDVKFGVTFDERRLRA